MTGNQENEAAVAHFCLYADTEADDYYEPCGPDNYMDDGEALASAGFGTDEDYGGYGDF